MVTVFLYSIRTSCNHRRLDFIIPISLILVFDQRVVEKKQTCCSTPGNYDENDASMS